MTANKLDTVKGFKIKNLNFTMMVMTSIVFIVIIYLTICNLAKYKELELSIKNYENAQDSSAVLRAGSDYLTEQVRMFAVSGNLKFLNNYFDEIKNNQRRNQAVSDYVSQQHSESQAKLLTNALMWSDKLTTIEYTSFRLASEGRGISLDQLPSEIRNIQLSEEDAVLSNEGKIRRATEMVFSELYHDYKNIIYTQLDEMFQNEIRTIRFSLDHSTDDMKSLLNYHWIMISVLFFLNIVMFGFIIFFVVHPLKIYIKSIQNHSLIELIGSYEFKYLALTYNNIYEVNNREKSQLEYVAEHDKLTGVYNRVAFDAITNMLTNRAISMALIIVDIDYFKQFNDSYGHEVGDKIIQKVAKMLEKIMRSSDKVIRYGGDEFCIIAMDVCEGFENVITNKMNIVSRRLSEELDDGLPKVTISCGGAISYCGYSQQLFNNADEALYEVKENGRNGCRISPIIIRDSSLL